MKIKEINSKSIISQSKIYDYVINPYVGCQHGCSYCYASFMKRFTGHKEPWGEFVDVKINAPFLLEKEVHKKKKKKVWMSGVCDPYQPLEEKYKLTRRCLDILVKNNWPVIIQTRSPLILRDMDILKESDDLEAGLSIGTADDDVRKAFEPFAPPVMERIKALEALKRNGIKTYAMIAPILPGAANLIEMLAGKADYIIIDRMNYKHANSIYKRYGWQDKNTGEYFDIVKDIISGECEELGIDLVSAY